MVAYTYANLFLHVGLVKKMKEIHKISLKKKWMSYQKEDIK